MPDNQEFFAPEYMNEHLERPLVSEDMAASPHLTLVRDLHALYEAEGTVNSRSLRDVWTRLEAEHKRRQNEVAHIERSHLRLLKPRAEVAPVPKRERARYAAHPVLTVLAALLVLGLMMSSLVAFMHFARTQFGAPPPMSVTATPRRGTPTPIPGYPYPSPGLTLSVSLPSSAGFSGLTWSPDSRQVAASTAGKVWIWGQMADGQPLVFDPKGGDGPVVLAWSPGAPRLAVGGVEIQIIDPGNGVVVRHYPAFPGYAEARVTALAWSPDGKRLAVAVHDPIGGNTVRILDAYSGMQLFIFNHQRAGISISSLSWSGDGQYLVSTNGLTVEAWNVRSGVVIFQRGISAPTGVAWSPGISDPSLIAFVDGTTTEVWDVWSRAMRQSYLHTTGGVLTWSQDGGYLASSSYNVVVIWNISTGAHLFTYTGHTHPIRSLAWSQDGNYLASADADVVRIWMA